MKKIKVVFAILIIILFIFIFVRPPICQAQEKNQINVWQCSKPFEGKVVLKFDLPDTLGTVVILKINYLPNRMAQQSDLIWQEKIENLKLGENMFVWQGQDSLGRVMPSGVYQILFLSYSKIKKEMVYKKTLNISYLK